MSLTVRQKSLFTFVIPLLCTPEGRTEDRGRRKRFSRDKNRRSSVVGNGPCRGRCVSQYKQDVYKLIDMGSIRGHVLYVNVKRSQTCKFSKGNGPRQKG